MRISDWSSDVCSSDVRAGYGIPPIGRYGHQCAVAAKRDARRLPAVHAQYPAQGLRLVAARARQAGLVRDARQAGDGVLRRNLRSPGGIAEDGGVSTEEDTSELPSLKRRPDAG